MNTSTKTGWDRNERPEQLPPDIKESGPQERTVVQNMHEMQAPPSVHNPRAGSWTIPALVVGAAIWAGLLIWFFR